MDPIADALPPEEALGLSLLARLMYESREHRRMVLAAVGATDEADLLARIRSGEVAEHPAYEHYLAARILADTQQAARHAMTDVLQEVNA